MAVHFATDARLLKDVHALQKLWFLHANLIGQRCKFFVVTELAELRVEVVHGMAQFVQAQMCFCAQLAVLIECILFEEATNFVTAGEKVLIGRMFGSGVCSEDGGLFRRRNMFFRQLHGTFAQS